MTATGMPVRSGLRRFIVWTEYGTYSMRPADSMEDRSGNRGLECWYRSTDLSGRMWNMMTSLCLRAEDKKMLSL